MEKTKIKTVEKPWGREEWLAHNDRYAGKIIHILKGKRLSKQYHNKKHETIYVDRGELLLEIDNKKIILKAGEGFVITPKMVHRFSSINEDVRLIEFSTPELEDVVRTEDDYGRVK